MWHKNAGRNQHPKPVGVLVGKLDMPMFEDQKMHVYMSFYVHVEAFGKPAAARAAGTRSATATHAAKDDEDAWHRRQDYHSFRRFDIVTYVRDQSEVEPEGEPAACDSVVYAVIVQDPSTQGTKSEQRRKFLVLYELQSGLFFLAFWPKWQRVSTTAGDLDLSTDVKCASPKTCTQMLDAWDGGGGSKILQYRATATAVTNANHPPPAIRLQQQAAMKAQKALKAADTAAEIKAEKAEKAEKAADRAAEKVADSRRKQRAAAA